MDVLEEDKKCGRDSGRRFWQCSFWDTMEGSAKVKSSVWKEINIFESYTFSCLLEDNCFTILCWPSAIEKHSSGLGFREWGRSRVGPSPNGWGALTPGCGVLFLGQAELELLEGIQVAVSREAGCAGPELAEQMSGDPHLGVTGSEHCGNGKVAQDRTQRNRGSKGVPEEKVKVC